MSSSNVTILGVLLLALAAGCESGDNEVVWQDDDALLHGQVMALAYSGYREGQHPDRGDGANNPSREEILEDLTILIDHGFGLIRMYDVGENTRMTLDVIDSENLPIKVVLGAWLRAEMDSFETCAWLDEPYAEEFLAQNRIRNSAEIVTAIELAERFEDIIVAVNVGNEALVDWNDHRVPVEQIIRYVREARDAISQPVTVAENYAWWAEHGAELAAEVDFIGVHTYPAWESRTIDEGLAYTQQNIAAVRAALPDKPIAILEAGWATSASEFADQASEENQARHFAELRSWATAANITVFFFEAFDEPWKGDPNNVAGAEKHWGLFRVDRTPKLAMEQQ